MTEKQKLALEILNLGFELGQVIPEGVTCRLSTGTENIDVIIFSSDSKAIWNHDEWYCENMGELKRLKKFKTVLQAAVKKKALPAKIKISHE